MVSRLLLAARTAFTAQTGSLVSPTRKVMSQSSGIEARNLMSYQTKQDHNTHRYNLTENLC